MRTLTDELSVDYKNQKTQSVSRRDIAARAQLTNYIQVSKN
jgi:hypothetical protein